MKTLLTPDCVIAQLESIHNTLLNVAETLRHKISATENTTEVAIFNGQRGALISTAKMVQLNIDALRRIPPNSGMGICVIDRFPTTNVQEPASCLH